MSFPLKRFLAIAVLLGWQAPGAFALGVGLHLAVGHHGHHGSHGASHEHEVTDLATAATHGHHHDHGAVPDHGHDVTIDAPAGVHRSVPSADAVPAMPPFASVTPHGESRFDDWSRRGPPTPLFRSHCALLL